MVFIRGTTYAELRKVKHKKSAREWVQRNPDKNHASVSIWQKLNPQKNRARSNRWTALNPEKVSERCRTWRKANPDKVNAKNHRRRTRKSNAGGSFTAQEWVELCAKYDHKCLRCNRRRKLTADHIVPVSKGGSSNICNIQPLCQPCNSIKHTKSTDFRTAFNARNEIK